MFSKLFKTNKKTNTHESTQFPKKKFGWKALFQFSQITPTFYESVKETLILSDAGGKTAVAITEKLENKIAENKIKEKEQAESLLKSIIKSFFIPNTLKLSKDLLNVVVFIGVNGVGKTSTAAKLAAHFQNRGIDKIIFGAADTFRAAAVEQLTAWAESLSLPIISPAGGNDAASVAYDTVHSALAGDKQLAIVDTAGRLHNNAPLIDQLGKLDRVIDKFKDKIFKKNILVLDVTQGTSGLEQTKGFIEKLNVDGLILTKLDSQAKGGIIVSISERFKLPVYFFTYGEGINDLKPFDIDEYVQSLF